MGLIRRVWAPLIRRASTHRTFVEYSGASTAFSVTGMLAGILVLRWLSPEDIGLWQSLLILGTYSLIFQVGAFKGLSRELPFRLGAGDDSAEALASTAQTVAAIGAALLVVAGLCLPFLVGGDVRLRYGLSVVSLGSAAELYNNYLVVTYRSNRSFDLLARIKVVLAVANIATLPMVYYLGYWGLALRYLAIRVVTVCLTHLARPLHVGPGFSWRNLWILLKVGVPIFTFAYLVSVGKTLPRVILLASGGAELVGLFAPAAAVVGLVVILPKAISQYISPQMSFRFGRSGKPQSIWPMAWKTGIGFLVISLPAIAVAYVILPGVISGYFPKYSASIPAVRWAMLAGAFGGAGISGSALRSLKAWRWLSLLTAVRLSLAYALPFGFAQVMQSPLEGVAVGFALSELVSFVAGMWCVYAATHSSRYAGPTRISWEATAVVVNATDTRAEDTGQEAGL